MVAAKRQSNGAFAILSSSAVTPSGLGPPVGFGDEYFDAPVSLDKPRAAAARGEILKITLVG